MNKKRVVLKRLFLIWGVSLMILPLFTLNIKAESGTGYIIDSGYLGEGNLYYHDVTIVTPFDDAYGTAQALGNNYRYSGRYTFISHAYETTNQTLGTQIYTFTCFGNLTDQGVLINQNQLQSILDQLDLIRTDDYTIIQAINDCKNLIHNDLINIDNLIDTISWTLVSEGYLNYSKTFDGEFSVGQNSITLGQKSVYIDVPVDSNIRYTPVIYHIHVPVDRGTAGDYNVSLSLYAIYNGARNNLKFDSYYKNNRNSIDVYIYNFRGYYGNNNRLELTIDSGNLTIYGYSNNLAKYEYIDSSDIEYWTLMSFFEQHFQNNDLNTPNDDLSNAVDDYIQQEDDLIDDFDNAMTDPALDPTSNSSNPSNWGNTFISSLSFIGHIFNTLTGASTGGNAFYLMINMSLMLGIALLIIGKRAI